MEIPFQTVLILLAFINISVISYSDTLSTTGNDWNSSTSKRSLSDPVYYDFGSEIGGGWKLVRRVQAGYTWHPATDHLIGTDVYGTFVEDPTIDATFSIAYHQEEYNEFLFITGDMSKWLIAKKDQVEVYGSNFEATIIKSSTSSFSYQARWHNREGFPEDPWISLTDHYESVPAGDILYGGASFGGTHASAALLLHNGANVFIRNGPSSDYYGGIGCRTVMLGGGEIRVNQRQPGLWDSNEPYCADILEEHAVRCCSDSYIPGFTQTQCNGNTFWSESQGLGCIDNVQYSVAASTCESVGARLCTATEMYDGCTQKTGCEFDLEYAWTSTEEWVEFEGSFYRYFDSISLDFAQAEDFCEDRGAHLVTLTSQDENDFVWYTLIGGTHADDGVWIGANDRVFEGNYVWVEDGSSASYTNWGSAEPNDHSGNEDCVHLGIFYGSGLWNDALCSSSLHFICEIGATDHQPIVAPTPTSAPTVTPTPTLASTVTPKPTSAPTVTTNDQPTFAPTGWQLLFRQTAETYLPKSTWLDGVGSEDNNNYSILDQIGNYALANGKFLFKLCWPNDVDFCNTWYQTSNPLDNMEEVTGYEAVDVPYTGQYWGGLALSSNDATLIDGSIGHINWWYAVGSTKAFGSGIPGPVSSDGTWTIAHKVELYIWDGATDHQPIVTPTPTSAPTVTPNGQPTFSPTGGADTVESYSYSFSYGFANEANNDHSENEAPKCSAWTCGSNSPVCNGPECCHCDDYCTEFGDCCSDYLEVCGRKENSDGFCDGSCGTKSLDNCWCDEDCVDHGDCCTDACESCGYNCHNSDLPPKPQCVAANCGSNSPICESSECCYCDDHCKEFGDCCSGYSDICSL